MKIQSPWMGRVKGSAGNMTGSKVYDKNVLRAKAFEVSNPNTAAQQTERNFFKDLSELVATIPTDVLTSLFQNKPKAMSRRNAITRQISSSFVVDGNEKLLDLMQVSSLGNAPTMDLQIQGIGDEDGTLIIDWEHAPFDNSPISDNYAMIAVLNNTKQRIDFLPTNASMSDGVLSVANTIDFDSNDDVQALLFVGKLKKGGKIALVGFGTMGVVNRPAPR